MPKHAKKNCIRYCPSLQSCACWPSLCGRMWVSLSSSLNTHSMKRVSEHAYCNHLSVMFAVIFCQRYNHCQIQLQRNTTLKPYSLLLLIVDSMLLEQMITVNQQILANLMNCMLSLIFVADNIYVNCTLYRLAAGRRQFNNRHTTLF